MLVLGIDPGIAIVGYGFVREEGSRMVPVEYGKITTPAGMQQKDRLFDIYQDLNSLIKKHKPDAVAVEKLFFSKNVKTAMTVSEARGAILLTLSQNNLPVAEYNPMQVKIAVSGYGGADKKQVQQMVKNILGLKAIPRPDDTADALAIAICHLESYKLQEKISNHIQ